MFQTKLNQAIARNQSLLVVGLDPNPEMLPPHYRQDYGSELAALSAWLHDLIAQTAAQVCAYKPSLGFYQALGAPGLELLVELLAALPPELPVILDAKHGDLNSSSALAHTAFEVWGVDAITLVPYTGQDQAAPFLVYGDKAVLALCCTSNPGAEAIQRAPTLQGPLYLQVVREVCGWGLPAQLGLEVGTRNPVTLTQVRAIAPDRLILLRSLWQQPEQLAPLLAAGLNADGAGLLLPVPQDVLTHPEPEQEIAALNQQIYRLRQQGPLGDRHCQLWIADVCLLDQHPHQDLILQLYDLECILFGEYQQASGAVFPYYIDLRKIISQPQVFQQVLEAYAQILRRLHFDRIAGIPYGSLPTAAGLSLRLQRPLIYPRKEVKAHGTRRTIEGYFEPGETAVVVDDILISGNSALEGVGKLEAAGLRVQDIVVFLDHGGGVVERLGDRGYRAQAVLSLTEITETLYAAGRLTEAQYQTLQAAS